MSDELPAVLWVKEPPEPVRSAATVLLVQPGDILIVGNVGMIDHARGAFTDFASTVKEATGAAKVFFFEEDIDLTVVRGDGQS